jgi:hypothetical protein
MINKLNLDMRTLVLTPKLCIRAVCVPLLCSGMAESLGTRGKASKRAAIFT